MINDNKQKIGDDITEKDSAAIRLMDAFTDISDDMILDTDRVLQISETKSSSLYSHDYNTIKDSQGHENNTASTFTEIENKPPANNSKKKRWFTVSISFAATLIVVFISIYMLPNPNKRRKISSTDSSTGNITASQKTESITEAGPTEARPTEAGTTETKSTEFKPTEAGTTEVKPTEAGTTEVKPTEAGTTEVNPTEAGITEVSADDPTHICIDSKIKSYESLSEMEADSDLIIRAERLDYENPILKYSNNEFYSGFTLSHISINRIYKDDTGNLIDGQTITILENEVYDTDSNIIYHIAGYRMMVPGHEYLLFLKNSNSHAASEDAYYVACGVQFGTISLSDDGRDISPKNPNGTDMTDISVFKEIWEDAKNKYQ